MLRSVGKLQSICLLFSSNQTFSKIFKPNYYLFSYVFYICIVICVCVCLLFSSNQTSSKILQPNYYLYYFLFYICVCVCILFNSIKYRPSFFNKITYGQVENSKYLSLLNTKHLFSKCLLLSFPKRVPM